MSLACARVTVTLLGIRVAFFVVAQVVILPWLVTVLKVSAWLAGVGPSGGLCWWLLIVSIVAIKAGTVLLLHISVTTAVLVALLFFRSVLAACAPTTFVSALLVAWMASLLASLVKPTNQTIFWLPRRNV